MRPPISPALWWTVAGWQLAWAAVWGMAGLPVPSALGVGLFVFCGAMGWRSYERALAEQTHEESERCD